ncbi:MAG: TRZ/ATZ family hydrolase [Gammaproteobacteria bacterium]|nr:TRZ/ATZ family hydrolase [Gammaproteobacteria bacterium]
MQIDMLISASWIIPIEPENTVLEDHAIAVNDGHIVAILPAAEAEIQFQAEVHIRRQQHVLMPGFINSHGHAAMSLMRGLADDLPLMDWLNNHIWPAENKWISPEFVHHGSLLACAEMIKSGTTCFNDMYFFPEETARAAEHAGMRAVVGLIVLDFPTAWAQNADEYLQKGISLHDQLNGNSLISTAFAPHAPYTVSDDPLSRIATYAEELDIPIHIHLHETAFEVQESVEKLGLRPIERLQKLELLSPRLIAVHMTQLEKEEIGLLADTGVHVVHCPESNLKLASGFCPVQALIEAGVNVALGTDGAASNNDLDMLGELRTAALLAKAVSGNASAVPALQALQMATLNGARALGLEAETGSLKTGKAADIIAMDLSGVDTQPVYHPASQIAYAAGRHSIRDVWVAGKQLLRDGQLTSLNPAAILEHAQGWKAKLAE